ncbi:TPA: hypothetical protein ACVFIK_007066, partial [Pseudomonas aeruginosa]
DALTSGARRADGEQLRALFGGDERLGHGRHSHETDDAQMRIPAETRKRRSGYVLSCESTKAQAIESVQARKRRSGIVQVRKGTEAALRFWRNPQKRFSVETRTRVRGMNELKITWF